MSIRLVQHQILRCALQEHVAATPGALVRAVASVYFEPKAVGVDFFTLNMLHMAAVFGLEQFAEDTVAIKKQQIDKMVKQFPHIKHIFVNMRSIATRERKKFDAKNNGKLEHNGKLDAKDKQRRKNSKKARKPKRTPFAVSPPSETIDDRSEERQQRQKEEEQQRQREEKKKWGRTIGATRGMYNHPLFLHTMRCKRCMGHLPCTKRDKFEESYKLWKKRGAPAFGWTV